jgi:hypothetical protein
MPRVAYMIPMQGFRPKTNPAGALAGLRLRGLGDSNTFSGCVQAYDANSNPVACGDPSAAVWMDANGNAVPAGTLSAPASAASAPGAGGAPTGSLLLYQGQWQVTPTLNVNTIISRVSQALKAYGLQVVNSQNDGGAFTIGNFNVMLTLQVTGSGFNQPADAGSIVDHAYYTVQGHMPVFSSTTLQSAPGSSVPALVPPGTGTNPATPNAAQTFTQWLESNAFWLGLGVVAVVVLPKIL